ncbi:hypothetical protein LLEC1_00660 [Akanthomyces lecanii]|uniref:Uncharacterized protein n=1 Tax=Cordyceps confragosa TaxID=2714763 RepID=A0A179IGL5_CORDF|nr:hypothetical protein LLEC1_00660 [Akanthomyces lecanii]
MPSLRTFLVSDPFQRHVLKWQICSRFKMQASMQPAWLICTRATSSSTRNRTSRPSSTSSGHTHYVHRCRLRYWLIYGAVDGFQDPKYRQKYEEVLEESSAVENLKRNGLTREADLQPKTWCIGSWFLKAVSIPQSMYNPFDRHIAQFQRGAFWTYLDWHCGLQALSLIDRQLG